MTEACISTRNLFLSSTRPEFFAQLNAELDTLFAQSAAVGPDNAYLPGSGATALNVSLGKRLLMGFVSIFSRLFRFLI